MPTRKKTIKSKEKQTSSFTRVIEPIPENLQTGREGSYDLFKFKQQLLRDGRTGNSREIYEIECKALNTKQDYIALQVDYEKAFKDYENCLQNPSINPALRQMTYSLLEVQMKRLEAAITSLETDRIREKLGHASTKYYASVYLNKLGIAHFLNKNFTEARTWMEASLNKGYFPAAKNLMNVALQENNHETILKYQLTFLEESCKQEHAQKVNEYWSDVIQTARSVLGNYLHDGKPEKEIEQFCMKFQRWLDVCDYEGVLLHFEKDPLLAKKWRRKLFGFIRAQKKEFDFTKGNIPLHLANFHLDKNEFEEAVEFIRKHPGCFTLDQRLQYAFRLLAAYHAVPKGVLLQVGAWYWEAVQCGDPEVLRRFLIIYTTRELRGFFDGEKTLRFLESQFDHQTLKADVHFLYALLFDEGHGQLQSDEKALRHYQIAADLKHRIALQHLAAMHQNGQGIPVNLPVAMAYYKQAMEAGNAEAGIRYASVLVQNQPPGTSNREPLHQAMKILDAVENMLQTNDMPENISLMLQGQVSLDRSEYLLLFNSVDETVRVDKTHSHYFEFYRATMRPGQYLRIITELERASQLGSTSTRISALIRLGLGVDKSQEEANVYFQQALELNQTGNEYDVGLHANLLMLLSLLGNIHQAGLSDSQEKDRLQTQALAYYQQALLIGEDYLAPSLMKEYDKFVRDPDQIPNLSGKLLTLFHALHQDPLSSLQQLQAKLRNPPPLMKPEIIFELTKHIMGMGEQFFNQPQLFEPLCSMLSEWVRHVSRPNTLTLLSIFKAVGKWHLEPATENLKLLFRFMDLRTLNFADLSSGIKILADCNFSPETQKNHILPLLSSIKVNELISSGPCTFGDTARFLRALSLLDANHPDDTCYILAQQIVGWMRSNTKGATFCDVSEIYHAQHYFLLKYPPADTWGFGKELRQLMLQYEAALQKDSAVTCSRTQDEIFSKLQALVDGFKQETFIREAGRRVDCQLNQLIFQYDGAAGHHLFALDGSISRASNKDILATRTLELAGYRVIHISRNEWHEVRGDEHGQRRLLKGKLREAGVSWAAVEEKNPSDTKGKLGLGDKTTPSNPEIQDLRNKFFDTQEDKRKAPGVVNVPPLALKP